jgi:EmrB/QacA subfamily drug resistance transporter
LSRRRLNVITLGILFSLFLASMEGTVVATAMPTIVGQLGGLAIYSWVFSIYLLTSTTTVPIYGKLSDIYGRKVVYLVSMGLFILGSILCGQAHTMEQLILFRAVQGLGAGGVLPLAFTIIGELFSLEQRARMQGLFSGIWGVSAIIGPLVGGFLVDKISWQWIFYINILPGLLAMTAVAVAWRDAKRDAAKKVVVDYLGAAFLTAGILCLLLGLDELGSPLAWVFLAAAAVLLAGLVWVERRAVDPILPFGLFRDRLFTVSILHGVLAGWALFGSLNFIPLFVQAVLGASATQAGISLTPQSLGWTLASVIGSRLLLKMGYRTLALAGMVLLSAGMFFMSRIGIHATQAQIMLYTTLMGIGMGLSVPAFLIAVQSTVRRDQLGVATSTLQFSRNIGGTLGVSVMGAFLSSRLASTLVASGINPASVSLDSLLQPVTDLNATLDAPLRAALAVSIANLFVIAFIAAVIGLLAVTLAPRGKISQLMAERATEIIAEEME